MSEQLTPEEIERLRAWRIRDIGRQIHPVSQVLIVDYMLRLHDERERLRNLQAEDVMIEHVRRIEHDVDTPAENWGTVDERELIAAAVRVMVASLDKPADSA